MRPAHLKRAASIARADEYSSCRVAGRRQARDVRTLPWELCCVFLAPVFLQPSSELRLAGPKSLCALFSLPVRALLGIQ